MNIKLKKVDNIDYRFLILANGTYFGKAQTYDELIKQLEQIDLNVKLVHVDDFETNERYEAYYS